jgi:hypothetical protein
MTICSRLLTTNSRKFPHRATPASLVSWCEVTGQGTGMKFIYHQGGNRPTPKTKPGELSLERIGLSSNIEYGMIL